MLPQQFQYDYKTLNEHRLLQTFHLVDIILPLHIVQQNRFTFGDGERRRRRRSFGMPPRNIRLPRGLYTSLLDLPAFYRLSWVNLLAIGIGSYYGTRFIRTIKTDRDVVAQCWSLVLTTNQSEIYCGLHCNTNFPRVLVD